MNYLSISFLALFLTLLVLTGLSLFTAIHGNYRRANELRRQFGQRIQLIPLFRMLRKQNVSMEQWLHRAPLSTVEKAVRQCESCVKTEECLDLLKNSKQIAPDHCSNEALPGYLVEIPDDAVCITA